MATKKPLVVSSGAITELVTGDTIPPNSLGSGIADLTTYLRGDGTWTTPAEAAGTLTGTTLATNVVTSSLTSVGQLNLLTVKGTTASDAPFLGAELISGGTWTLGAGWTGDNTVGFTHATGYTSNLSYSFIPTIGARYRFSSNISAYGGGQWGLGFAGGAYGTQASVGYVWDLVATAATPITVAAWDSNLVATLKFSIKQIIAVSTPAMSVLDSTGTSRLEVRAGSSSNPNNTFIGLLSGGYNSQGSLNVGLGNGALQNNLMGGANTAVGYQAMLNSLGSNNTAVGCQSLKANVNGYSNVSIGYNTLLNNTTGYNNTAVGVSALTANTIGLFNTAVGVSALQANVGASYNTAFGYQALQANTNGSNNIAVGSTALFANTSGGNNSAFGLAALTANTTASNNSAFGFLALQFNTSGTPNTAVGANALVANTTGANNVAVGYQALTASTTGVATFGAITAGTLYTDGTYNGKVMTSVVGATFTVYPTVNITVTGGVVTACTLVTAGTRATVTTTTVLTVAAALIGGTGSGFTITVATFAQGAGNSAFGTGAGSAITTGSNNVVIGSYTGAAGPISLTGSNYIVLSDGAANVRQTYNASGALAFGTAGTAFGTSGQVLQSNGSAAVPTWATPSSVNIGFLNIPQNIQDTAYTLVLSDSGYHIYHSSGASAATYTIPAATSVAFPIGTAINFVNMATTAVTIAITTDTMYLSGTAGTTGSRTLAQYGSATAIKVSGLSSSGVWLISGLGLT